jgi:hypothetical protein
MDEAAVGDTGYGGGNCDAGVFVLFCLGKEA